MIRPRALAKPKPPNDSPRPRNQLLTKEWHVEQTITQFLELDGWRSFKMEANSERGFVQRVRARLTTHAVLHGYVNSIMEVLHKCMRAGGVGEPGMPDRLFIRYNDIAFADQCVPDGLDKACGDIVLWIEFKKPGEKPRLDQLEWHEAERARGAMVLVVSDIDDFMRNWYPKSGLQRRPPVVR